MTGKFRILAALMLAAVAAAHASPSAAAQKAAIFPFDLHDAEQDAEVVPEFKAEDLRRLKVVAEELKSLMEKSGKYEVVDLSPLAKEVDAASPYSKCNACEVPLAKQAGADLAITGYVDKVSDALISLQVFARDVNTGEMTKTMSAEIRGNTDELWLHGIRYLWRNRFNVEAKAQ